MPRHLPLVSTALLAAACVAGEAEAPRYLHLQPSVPPGIEAPKLDPAAIPASEYAKVIDGAVVRQGQPQRYWGVIGGIPNSPAAKRDKSGKDIPLTPEERKEKAQQCYQDNEALIRRFQDLGFNLHRLWRGLPNQDYVPGDGSFADVLDHYVATAKKHGFSLWLAGANPGVGEVKPEVDVAIIDDPTTAEAWKAAIAEAAADKGKKSVLNRARFWDPRLEAIAIRNASAVLTHYNRYTGLRWCDDPVFVHFELSNEEWFMKNMLGGIWLKLPAFFQQQLIAQWNAFLVKKYGSQEKLLAAWGTLLAGEDAAKGTVAFAPMGGKLKVKLAINDANAQAIAAVNADAGQEIDPKTLPEARGRDVMEFLVQMHVAHKQREAAALKPLGRATASAPLAYDTGIGYEIQSAWLHQQSEVTVHDAYVNGHYSGRKPNLGPFEDDLLKMQAELEWSRMVNNAGDWVDWLAKPPGISQGVPWLEHNRVEGKPFFAYETQIQQPAKYRADFPLRLAALANIQDWTTACWHYWGSCGDVGSVPRPFDKPMDITVGSHPQGYHYTYDEVQNAMIRAAGIAFRNRAYAPAATPTTFIYGRKSLYDPKSMRYAGSYGLTGMDMLPTTYQHGVRLLIDPSREDDQVIGPVVKGADYNTHNPYTPTPQITFDWKQAFLRMDSPASVIWTGHLAKVGGAVEFANGISLSQVSISNPPGIYEPIAADDLYLAFALYSEDGQPLAQAKRAALSLVSTSFNTGFKRAEGKTQQGTTPVLVARVAGTVGGKAIAGMRYVLRDWHMAPLGEGTVGAEGLAIPADKPVWLVELSR